MSRRVMAALIYLNGSTPPRARSGARRLLIVTILVVGALTISRAAVPRDGVGPDEFVPIGLVIAVLFKFAACSKRICVGQATAGRDLLAVRAVGLDRRVDVAVNVPLGLAHHLLLVSRIY